MLLPIGLVVAAITAYSLSWGRWWPASVTFLVLAVMTWRPVRTRLPALRTEPEGDWTPSFDPELPRVGEAEPRSERRIHGLIVPYEARVLQGGVTVAAVIGGLALIDGLQGPRWWTLGIGVFLLATAARAYRGSLDRGSYIALTQSGIYSRQLGDRAFVAWDNIVDVQMIRRYRQPFVRVQVTTDGAVQRPGQNLLFATVERAITGPDLVLGVKGLTLSPDQIIDLMQRYLAHPEDRPLLDTTLSEALASRDIRQR